jgi:two-component system alkaline phosphatase synthesis response regulator PhoP
MSKILIVDDDKDIIFMIKSVLEKNGYEVMTASDGQKALDAIESNAPDLMIADLTMPVMDGWRLSMKVRQHAKCRNIPIIVLSGLVAEKESRPQEPYEPYNVLIAKPFDVFKLAEKVKELLKVSSK